MMQRSTASSVLRTAGRLAPPLFRRAAYRREGRLAYVPLSPPLHQRQFHSTHNGRSQLNASPTQQHQQQPTRASSSASSLNAFSQRVRQHLASLPPPDVQASGSGELWMLDRLLYLLLHPDKSVEGSTRSGSVAAASSGRISAGGLHPLLCVRVLERLGPAVCTSGTNKQPNLLNDQRERAQGWTTRHAYPSLTSSGHAVDGLVTRNAQALSLLTAVVLLPLLPLLGDGTSRRPPHTQTVPVLPVVVEWLCTLPTSEEALPIQQWLPWIVAQYAASLAAADLRDGRDGGGEKEAPGSCERLPLESTGTASPALPPLLDLLPHLLQKLSPHLSERNGKNRGSLSILCEEQVAVLLDMCRRCSVVITEGDGLAVSAATAKSCATVGEVLWWSGDVSLLHLPGVRRALASVVEQGRAEERGAAALLSSSDEKESCAASSAGVVPGRERRVEKADNTTVSGMGGLSAVQVASSAVSTGSPAAAAAGLCPQVVLRLADDDAFRRFLLRLAALQRLLSEVPGDRVDAQDQHANPVVLLAVELEDALVATHKDSSHTNSLEDPDVVLRFIQPLYDYVLLLLDTPADTGSTSVNPARAAVLVSPVRLSFTAVTLVLSAVFQRLEELKKQSSCHHVASADPALRMQRAADLSSGTAAAATTTTAYTLLPQKARLHTLKRLCELLLHHARSAEAAADAARRASTTASPRLPPPASAPLPLLFVDVAAHQQEAVLRRLCGAARALVRVVMEERRCSLLEEGPEGSVLTASSITAARRSRAGGITVPESRGTLTESAALPTSPPAAAATASTPGVTSVSVSSAAPAASFEHTLRTLAYRVVEPALWRLYDTCAQQHVALPLHVLRFADWMACLGARRGAAAAASGEGANSRRLSRDAYGDNNAPPQLQPFRAVMEAARDLHESVGGRSGLQTAQQVLPHPGQQSISALVEGVRLAALQCFVFDGLWIPAHAAKAGDVEAAAAYTKWVLDYTSAAFFSVWQRTAERADQLSAPTDSATAVRDEQQQQLRHRLGLLSLALHVRVLMAQQRLRVVAPGPEGTDPSSALSLEEGTGAAFPSSLSSLLHCLLSAPAHYTTSQTDVSLSDEWPLVLTNEGILQSCRRPPAGTPSGSASLWEFVEELEEMAADAGSGDVTWRWLGSLETLWDVMEEEQTSQQRESSLPSPARRFFLLPWTTVAQSHQLCRVYDESGQSRRAALEWEAAVQVWLGGSRGESDSCPSKHQPVVRLVSIAEELRFFSALQHTPTVQLSSSVRVVCADVAREVEVVAPALQHLLRSCAQPTPPQTGGAAASAGEEEIWYAESDYDGLD